MKILFFSPYFYPYTSGLTTYPWKILNQLSKEHQITILTFNHQKNKFEKEIINNLKIIRMPYFLKISKGFISPQAILYFIKEIKKTNLLFLNQPNVEGFFLPILAKIFRKKTISLVHCFLYGGKNFFEKIIFKIANFFVFFQLISSDKIIFYTKDYFYSLPYSKFLKNKKIHFILPPIKKLSVDKNYLKKLSQIKKNNDFLIGFSGRISQEKGIEYFIQAISNIKYLPADKQGQISNIKILFGGPYGKDVADEYPYFLKIKKLLEENKISYKFLGNLNEAQLGAFYKAIDVLVLPSINSTEAFGMVQAEAMLIGTPVIASSLPGVRIPIRLTKMGILVEPQNEKQLTEAILEILKNKNKYTNKTLIKNASKIFNIKNVFNFYKKILTLVK